MRHRIFCFVLIFVFVATASAHAALPQPPCAVAAIPAYPAPDTAPTIAIWHGRDLEQGKWQPPPCTGWPPASKSKLIVAVAGSFSFNGSIDRLLNRVGAISSFLFFRYWATTDKEWRPLAYDTSALTGPDKAERRADFSAAELTNHAELYYWEDDSRSGQVVYRLSVMENTSGR